ncbi:MAG TPA: hypothetical protein DEB31_11735 [Clostridiales bacterium]|nr:hypothetical protein [Clostridiales bacterium]
MAKYCTRCGRKLEDDMMFCTGCGRNLRPAQESPVEEEQKKPGFLGALNGLFGRLKGLFARTGRRRKGKDAAYEVPAEELSLVEETIIAAPAEELPAVETSAETVPVEELPGAEPPEEAVPVEELPGAEPPEEAVPVEELPGAETPVKAAPAETGAGGEPEKAAEEDAAPEQEPEPKKGKKAKKGKSAGEAKEKKAKRSKNAKPVEVTPQKGGKKKLLIIVVALVAAAAVVFVLYLRAERSAAAEEAEQAAQETQAAQEEPAEQETALPEEPAGQETALPEEPAEEQPEEPQAADLPTFEINGLLGLQKDALNQELGEAHGQLMTSDMCVEWHEDYNMAVHYLNDAAGAFLLMNIEGTKMDAAILGVRPGSMVDEADAALLGGGGAFITETSVADNGRWTRIYKMQTPDGQESNVFLHLEGDTVFAVVVAVADAYSGTDIGQKFYDAEYFVWLGSRSEEVSAIVE